MGRSKRTNKILDSFGSSIAGEWIEAGNFINNVNPSDTEDIIGRYHQATPSQLTDALTAASLASPIWAAYGLEKTPTGSDGDW